MAETYSGNFKISTDGRLVGDNDIGNNDHAMDYKKLYNITNGTGADQANNLFSDTRTLTASSTEDLDLAGGLTNGLGTTLTFTAIKGIIISAAAANTNNVLVGGASSNQFINWVGDGSDVITVRPGGTFALFANDATGYAVTASTGDLLKIANSSSGTSVTYDIILIGEV